MGGRAVIVNPQTGEAVLRDGAGNETRIIYTEEAIVAVESALDVSVLELLQRAVIGHLKVSELQALVWAGVNAHRARSGSTKQVSAERAMKLIARCGGVIGVMPVVADALTRCSVLGLADIDDDEDDDDDDEGDPDGDPTNGDEGDASGQPAPPESTP